MEQILNSLNLIAEIGYARFKNNKKKKKKMTDAEIVIRRKELAKKEKVAATLDCCSDRRKSVGPSAPIAYATAASPPDEAVAWPGRRCRVLDIAVA